MRPQRPLKLRMRPQHPFGGRGARTGLLGGGGPDAPPASPDVPASFGGRSPQVGGGGRGGGGGDWG
jgi:hypothetical protein